MNLSKPNGGDVGIEVDIQELEAGAMYEKAVAGENFPVTASVGVQRPNWDEHYVAFQKRWVQGSTGPTSGMTR